jgi:tRNA-specific 2-thiouridylase
VFDKDKHKEALIVGTLEELGKSSLVCRKVNWVSIDPPISPLHVKAKIRYRAQDVHALVSPSRDSIVIVSFDQPMRDITPGQAVVFYDDDVCLGGGIIDLETE